MGKTSGVRRLGSAATDLSWVASGRLDAFWERGLSPWDMAAGLLLVREAGGRATGIAGKDDALQTGNILAANETIHTLLQMELGAIRA
jgi:myo-inositol-1(or 4)-monophosphatase